MRGPGLLGGETPEEARRVVRNALREAVAVGVVVTAWGLWLASVTSAPYVSLAPMQGTLLDAFATVAIGASLVLVLGRRAVEAGADVLGGEAQ